MKICVLHIETTNLQQQKCFYAKTLGLPVNELSKNTIEVQVGYSVLRIEEKPTAKPYHVAFHISAKKEKEALTWLQKRVAILKMGQEEIIDFSSWNAKSIYFYDADKNILEFISRRHMHQTQTSGFVTNDIGGIAEIGLAVDKVKAVYTQLHRQVGLPQYFGDLEKFCPIGNDDGLLITVNQHQKTWFPTKDPAQNAPFTLSFTHRDKTGCLYYDGQGVDVKMT